MKNSSDEEPMLELVVRDIKDEKINAGSVKLLTSTLSAGKLGQTYKQWVVLCDNRSDNEHDNFELGKDDQAKDSRIELEFTLTEV